MYEGIKACNTGVGCILTEYILTEYILKAYISDSLKCLKDG